MINIINDIHEINNIMEKNKKFLIFIKGDKCPPCRQLMNNFEEIVESHNTYPIYTITIDRNNHQFIEEKFNIKITTIPVVLWLESNNIIKIFNKLLTIEELSFIKI